MTELIIKTKKAKEVIDITDKINTIKIRSLDICQPFPNSREWWNGA